MKKGAAKKSPIAELPRGISVFKQWSGADIHGVRRKGWVVRIGKKFSGTKTKSKFFGDLGSARDHIASLKPHQDTVRTAQLSPEQVSDAVLALKNLTEREAGLSLSQAVDLALKYHNPKGGKKTVKETQEEMIAELETAGAKKTSLAQSKSLYRKIDAKFGARIISTVGHDEIRTWMDEAGKSWSARTRRNYQKYFAQLFNYAVRHQYTGSNPCDVLTLPLQTRRDPEILTVDQTRKLLQTAQTHFPELLTYVALMAFGWLRRSEAVLLENTDIRNDRTIMVPSRFAKKRQHRIIPVCDTLHAWLAVAPKAKRPCPSANVDVMGKKLAELATKAKVTIPDNALRRGSISYALAYPPTREGKKLENTAGNVAFYAGNSEGVIFGDYRNVVGEKEGAAYWRIRPKAVRPKKREKKP